MPSNPRQKSGQPSFNDFYEDHCPLIFTLTRL